MIDVDAHKKGASRAWARISKSVRFNELCNAIRPALLRGGANAEGRYRRLSGL
jgi:hypothetical protein